MASADKEQLGSDLSAYLDGELSPRRAREVERLLRDSEDARRLLAELRAVSQELRDLPRMRAPRALSEEVRRAGERQIAVPPHAPAGGMRVLRLSTRVVASAAVIAICMFAGWTMHDRMAPPPVSDRQIATAKKAPVPKRHSTETLAGRGLAQKAAPAEVAVADAPALARAELETLGYVGADRDEDGVRSPSPEPQLPTGEVLVAATPPALGMDEAALALDLAGAAPDASPVMDIVIAPRDAEQFDAALQLVAAWRQQPPPVATRMPGGAGKTTDFGRGRAAARSKGAGRAGELAERTRREVTVRVPPARVTEILQSLEQQAPQQVRVAMTFSPRDLPRVQRMVVSAGAAALWEGSQVAESEQTPPEPAPALARAVTPAGGRGAAPPEPDTFKSRRPTGRGGGQRGRVVRQPAEAKRGVLGRAEAAEQLGELATGVAPEALPDEMPGAPRALNRADRPDRAGRKGGSPVQPKREAPADTKGQTPDPRCPRVADVARATSESIKPPAAGDQLTAEQTSRGVDVVEESRQAGVFIHERARGLRDQLDAMYEAMFGAVFGALSGPGPEGGPEGPATVTLRVTVLPPPPATRPASAAPSADAP